MNINMMKAIHMPESNSLSNVVPIILFFFFQYSCDIFYYRAKVLINFLIAPVYKCCDKLWNLLGNVD